MVSEECLREKLTKRNEENKILNNQLMNVILKRYFGMEVNFKYNIIELTRFETPFPSSKSRLNNTYSLKPSTAYNLIEDRYTLFNKTKNPLIIISSSCSSSKNLFYPLSIKDSIVQSPSWL
jgi:hypothetical protein